MNKETAKKNWTKRLIGKGNFYTTQEGLDNWNGGEMWYGGWFGVIGSEVFITLKEVLDETKK